MRRAWHVLVREYLENVRTRAFLVGLVLAPLWFGLIFLVPRMAGAGATERQRVVVVDATGVLAEDLRRELETVRTDEGARFDVEVLDAEQAFQAAEGPSPASMLRHEASQGRLIAVFLSSHALEKTAAPPGETRNAILAPATLPAMTAAQAIGETVNRLVNRRILEEASIDPATAARLQRPAVAYSFLDPAGKESGGARAMVPLVVMVLLFMGIVGIGQMLISSTLEEKASRVYEILLSSLSPVELMAGKVLGICAVGLTLMAIWAGGGILAALASGLGGLVRAEQAALFAAYYVLGFLLIASLMVAVGSACNTLKEAQNLMAPISLMLALPMVMAIVVLRDPNGTLATVGSFIPPFTPFVMMARVASVPGPPTWQVWASLLLLALSTWAAIRLAARVFRVGILLYGKPPRLGEILRWLRTP